MGLVKNNCLFKKYVKRTNSTKQTCAKGGVNKEQNNSERIACGMVVVVVAMVSTLIQGEEYVWQNISAV